MAALQADSQPNKKNKIYYPMTKRKSTERREKNGMTDKYWRLYILRL